MLCNRLCMYIAYYIATTSSLIVHFYQKILHPLHKNPALIVFELLVCAQKNTS